MGISVSSWKARGFLSSFYFVCTNIIARRTIGKEETSFTFPGLQDLTFSRNNVITLNLSIMFNLLAIDLKNNSISDSKCVTRLTKSSVYLDQSLSDFFFAFATWQIKPDSMDLKLNRFLSICIGYLHRTSSWRNTNPFTELIQWILWYCRLSSIANNSWSHIWVLPRVL